MKSISLGILLFAMSSIGLSPALAQEVDDGGGGGATTFAAPTEEVVERSLVTYLKSRTDAPRSATVVTVTNQSKNPCQVKIDWFQGFVPDTPACTTTAVVGPGVTHDFCSREVLSNITTCNSTCDPELTFAEGKAIVSSSRGAACWHIGVDARVYYTKGEGNDTGVEAVSNPKIVRAGQPNIGDDDR